MYIVRRFTSVRMPRSEGQDSVVTVTGAVAADVVKSEVVETWQMTEGVRGVIDRLVVTPR